MKACGHCGKPMADAAPSCTACGMVVGARLGPVAGQFDEPLGFERRPLVLWLIVAALVLLVAAALAWFVA